MDSAGRTDKQRIADDHQALVEEEQRATRLEAARLEGLTEEQLLLGWVHDILYPKE